MFVPYKSSYAYQLLVKPFHRVNFILLFIFVSSLSKISAYLIVSQPIFNSLLPEPVSNAFVSNTIAGLFLGCSQWLVIRKYIPDWRWIFIVALSGVFSGSIQAATKIYTYSIFSSGEFSQWGQILWLLFSSSFLVLFLILYGYLQWYILRSYAINSRFWILLPLLAGLIKLFFLLPLLLETSFQFRFPTFYFRNTYILDITLLPVIQAIAFCILKKKSSSISSVFQSPLAISKDTLYFRDIKELQNTLYTKISQLWKTDLETSVKQLKYLVGVSIDGEMILCEPMNQHSIDNIDRTPLTALVSHPNSEEFRTESLKGFAKFQVVFQAPASIRVYSWQARPLIWLLPIVLLEIAGINFLASFLYTLFLPRLN